MYITLQTIVTIAGVITALGIIVGAIIKVYNLIAAQERQDEEIKEIKEEQKIVVKAQLACLKGLKEQGCNGPVAEGILMLEEYLNKRVHEVKTY